MNILFTDPSPIVSARSMTDVKASALITDAAKCLSSALRVAGVKTDDIYKMWQATHANVAWAGASRDNFNWLVSYALTAAGNFAKRTGAPHPSVRIILAASVRDSAIPAGELTAFPVEVA